MKKIFFNLSILAIVFTFFNSCSTDFEVAAPYKEIPIVFGLLNKSDQYHFIKVNKAYLNKDGSAYLAGTVRDSNLYPYPLDVKLIALNSLGIEFDSVKLDTVHVTKEPGNFQTNNVYYRTPSYKLEYLSASKTDTVWADYVVRIRRLESDGITLGKIIAKSKCSIVGEVRFKVTPTQIDLWDPIHNATRPEYKNQSLSWNSARNGRRYSAFLRFKFKVENDGLQTSELDSIDMQLMSNNRVSTSDGLAQINYLLAGEVFYNKLRTSLAILPFGYRRVYVPPLEIHFQFAAQDLDTYMEINNSTISLSEVVPEYTNIEGGLGVFSSRTMRVFKDIKQVNLSLNSITGLKNSSLTKDLSFQ